MIINQLIGPFWDLRILETRNGCRVCGLKFRNCESVSWMSFLAISRSKNHWIWNILIKLCLYIAHHYVCITQLKQQRFIRSKPNLFKIYSILVRIFCTRTLKMIKNISIFKSCTRSDATGKNFAFHQYVSHARCA